MLQIFVPAALVMVSFWMSRASAPSRTIIIAMTVLTETHLTTGTNQRLPPVAYIKAVDVYLGFCYLLNDMEFSKFQKKNDNRKSQDKKSEHKPTPPTPDLLHDARLDECTCNAAPTSIIAVIKQPNRFCVKHIDIVSRFVFPSALPVCGLLQLVFMYWVSQSYDEKKQKSKGHMQSVSNSLSAGVHSSMTL
ncbi:hypothetical protein ANCCEY_07799 [Ancylostoma ceylanicum]|uniref:Neurotransmitter-gated ion-channel transmembrane domain-containing protein n=1 Tax=Ancylostoma ceylanicum TaxID=53326 RepID=A0A0D6LZP5_9BILA|nr:hypothetical protein ANCCEY_07799 [Ancylostoma ceylanicum]